MLYTYFQEIPINDFPYVDKTKYPDYFYENSLPTHRLFKYKNLYMEIVIDDETGYPYLSFINLGKPIKNICQICFPIMNELIDEYGIMGFQWTLKGTTSFLKRFISTLDNKQFVIDILNDKINDYEIIIRRTN